MSKDNRGNNEETLSLSKQDLSDIIEKASAGAVKAALEALKPKDAPVAAKGSITDQAMEGMSETEKAAFLASFGSGTCFACGQPASKGRYACKGKHKEMVCFPKDPYWGTYFQGVFANGAKYLSNGPGHTITVPAENDFEHQIEEWVNMERQNAQGKKASHNSGSIGSNGNQSGFRPFNQPGFRG